MNNNNEEFFPHVIRNSISCSAASQAKYDPAALIQNSTYVC